MSTPKPKTGNRGYHNRQSCKETMANSWSQEAEDVLREANEALGRSIHPHFKDTMSLHLRKAARLLVMCADRMDYVKKLKGETLIQFIDEELQEEED